MRTRFRHVRALAAVALMTVALASLGATAAAEEYVVTLDHSHGLSGDSVTVNVTTETTEPAPESTDSGPLPQATGNPTCAAFWDDDQDSVTHSECDFDRYSGISWSGSFTVPEDATEGAHTVEVRDGPTKAATLLGSATFTVDAPVVTTTSPRPPPTTTNKPTGEPTQSTDDPTSAAAATSSDETISTTNADASVGGGPPGIVTIMAAFAIIVAGILSWIIRGLRQRSPKWVSQHVRVVAAAGPLQIIENGPRRRPATSVRLEIHRDEPRQERSTP
jgi:hypothetical protein